MDSIEFDRCAVTYRMATSSDYDSLGHVMFAAVRQGTSHYTEEQRQAWVPQPRSGAAWTARLDSQFIVLAELRGTPIGFMSLAERGYIDFAYIPPEYRRRGIFRELYQRIEAEVRSQGLSRLWVHASLNARDAFASLGFSIVREETVWIGNVSLNRYEMENNLKVELA